nr:hypothetical protein [Tanacetum cinerariifolium]
DNPHQTLKGKGIVDSECLRHMTKNKAYLIEYQNFNGGHVAFGGSKGQITRKASVASRVHVEEASAPVESIDHLLQQLLIKMHPHQSSRGIFLNQSKYAIESLKKYEMVSCNLVDTSMVEKSKLDEDTQGKAVDPTHYHGMVGTLMYLTSSRPDMDSIISLTAFADADHVGCQDTRRSTSGSMQLLGDRLVSWSS